MPAETISISDLRQLMDHGRPLNIVDVRTPGEFNRVHAVGARLMPLDSFDPAAARGSTAEPVYVICQSGGRAAQACQRLEHAGVARAFNIEGGMAAWEKSGLPVERGSGGVISLERQVRIVAGFLVLLGAILAWTVHPVILALSALVGAGLMFAGITNYCGMGLLLGKMPWNR